MSIFGTMMSKIFNRGDKDEAPAGGSSGSASHDRAMAGAAAKDAAAAQAAPAPTAMSAVDVEARLTGMAASYGQKVNWRTSIVDLMSMLGIDNSLPQRRALAAELGYTGDTTDTATMNIWLHKQVMRKLAENGGTVPADLLD